MVAVHPRLVAFACLQAGTRRVAQAAKKPVARFGTQRTSRPVQVGHIRGQLKLVSHGCPLRAQLSTFSSCTAVKQLALNLNIQHAMQGTKQVQKKAQAGMQRLAQKAKSAAKPVAKSAQRAAPSGGLFGRRPGDVAHALAAVCPHTVSVRVRLPAGWVMPCVGSQQLPAVNADAQMLKHSCVWPSSCRSLEGL